MPPTPDRPSLPRVLGLVDVTASGVGIIVGAGIYVLLGPATERAGGLVWLAFVLSAVGCGLTALSYAELSSVFPRAGGEYEYARHSMHRHGAFMVGWTMLAGLTVAGATVALGFARYFNYFWPIGSRLAGLGLLVAMSSLAALGIRRSTWVVVAFSVIQIGGLLFVSAGRSVRTDCQRDRRGGVRHVLVRQLHRDRAEGPSTRHGPTLPRAHQHRSYPGGSGGGHRGDDLDGRAPRTPGHCRGRSDHVGRSRDVVGAGESSKERSVRAIRVRT